MSTSIAEAQPLSPAVLEHILGTGDLSKLTTQGRVDYYVATCRSLGLNPLTRPFRFLAFNGQIQLYATKDCGDQLRTVRNISLHIVEKQLEGDLFIVTARARTKDGREDEDLGAVTLPRSGDPRANAIMKAMTKAKRRVTLSICGLGGMPDESELDTMPGAQTFDAEDELPVAPIRAAAAATQRAPRIAERAPDYEAPPKSTPELGERQAADTEAWLQKLRTKAAMAGSHDELLKLEALPSVKTALASAPEWVKSEITGILIDAFARVANEPKPPMDDLEIVGADKLAAG